MSRRTSLGVSIVALTLFGPASQAAQAPGGYSAPALYNLANSYAREGKPGLAVLNYERAKLLQPDDPDIEANLRHVREVARLPPATRTPLERVSALASRQILAWAGVLGLVVAGIGALSRRFYPRHRGKLLAATLLGLCMLALSVANAVALWAIMHEAVVIARSAQVRVSPVTMEEPIFLLPEASVVQMSAEHDGFVLVRAATGQTGWVPSADLAPILQTGTGRASR